jgi:hypothetical protein
MRETDDSPPQDKRAEVLTPVLSLRASNELSFRAPSELSLWAPNNERAQALAHEISLRAPSDKRAEALDREMSLRAADLILPSQAGTEPLAWITMRANVEETIVIKAQTLGTPTTTLEISPYNQAKLDEIKSSRLDGTYAPPEGMTKWCEKKPGMTSEWVIWRNNEKAATDCAKSQKMKLLPHETRPFNYARIKEDEAPPHFMC